MIKYGLKLWSNNSESEFREAKDLIDHKKVDFIELYHNPDQPFEFEKLKLIAGGKVTIHNTHSHGWHEFDLQKKQLEMWKNTLVLADYFKSDVIVVHPGQARNFEVLSENLSKIDDPRILLENMAGLDTYGNNVYGRTYEELLELKSLKSICFDFEKAVKSACFLNIEYTEYISKCLEILKPLYFHISGGDKNSSVDQHTDLSEATFSIPWIHEQLSNISKDREVGLVFETPRKNGNLKNDVANMEFFKSSNVN